MVDVGHVMVDVGHMTKTYFHLVQSQHLASLQTYYEELIHQNLSDKIGRSVKCGGVIMRELCMYTMHSPDHQTSVELDLGDIEVCMPDSKDSRAGMELGIEAGMELGIEAGMELGIGKLVWNCVLNSWYGIGYWDKVWNWVLDSRYGIGY